MTEIPITTRRQLMMGGLCTLSFACTSSKLGEHATFPSDGARKLTEIERRVGGRVGVFALDVGSGKQLEHRADERFAMCSTFKWVLAAAVLERVDRGQLALEEPVAYGQGELLQYAPVTREHVGNGSMTVEALARAAVTVS